MSRLRTKLFGACCAPLLMLPSPTAPQSDRQAATEILAVTLAAVRFDSLCGRSCRVIVVDTTILGANVAGQGPEGVPVVDWAYARVLRTLGTTGRRFVPGAYPFSGHWRSRDTASVWVEFTPPALTMADSGEVYFAIAPPTYPGYGIDAYVTVKKLGGKWRVVRIHYGQA